MRDPGRLRIVAWNANGGVHEKLPYLAAIEPDIAVICECADEEIMRRKAGTLMEGVSMRWVGRLPNKGVAILGYGEFAVELDPIFDDQLEWVAPIRVTGPVPFNLLAIWASNHRASQYSGPNDPNFTPQFLAALSVYKEFIESGPTVMAGDFNDGAFWDDKPRRRWPFSKFVDAADAVGLVSAYRHSFPHPAAEQHTLYWQTKTPDVGYHIDHVFVPRQWCDGLRCEIGTYDEWVARTDQRRSLSDHTPVVVDMALPGAL